MKSSMRKKIAVLLAVCMMLTLLFAVYFMVAYGNHVCPKHNCEICLQIQYLAKKVKSEELNSAYPALAGIILTAFAALVIPGEIEILHLKKTPVVLKVKMNN